MPVYTAPGSGRNRLCASETACSTERAISRPVGIFSAWPDCGLSACSVQRIAGLVALRPEG